MAISLTISASLAILILSTSCCYVEAAINISQINVNDIQQQLPAQLANTNLSMDNAKTLLRDKCVQVAGEEEGNDAYAEIETATVALGECVSTIVNYTAVQEEIEKASPLGELDVVFNKYCKKRPEAIVCIESFNSKLVPCLEPDEQESQEIFMRIVRSLLSFICHKGGDQIALFIAEKGPECLQSKWEDIQQCINSTFSGYVPADGIEKFDVKALPKFVMGEKQCEDMLTLETCIVEKLEKCEEITPANIVESMFRFIKNETICRSSAHATSAKRAGNSGATLFGLNTAALALTLAVFWALNKRAQP